MPTVSAWKVIGLLFAGPGDSTYSIGCRITSIVQKLDITPWNTIMPTVSATYKTIVISPLSYTTMQDSCYVTLSGRKYFYVGK
jgi:anaerobic C4-dicarboxylate transporter